MAVEMTAGWEQAIESIEKRLQRIEQRLNQQNCWVDQLDTETLVNRNSLLHSMASNVTAVVGLKEAVLSKYVIIKITWILLFLLGTSATVYYVIKNCMEYSENPIATKISLTTSEYFRYQSFKLCIYSWLDEQKLSTGLSPDARQYSLGYLKPPTGNHVNNFQTLRSEFEKFYRQKQYDDPTEYFFDLAYDATMFGMMDNMDEVSFQNQLVMQCDGCDETFGVRKTFVYQHDVCYQFRLKPVTLNTLAQLTTYADVNLVLPSSARWPTTKTFWTLFVESGNGSLLPLPYESGVVLFNKTNSVIVNRNVYHKLSTASRPCVDAEDGSQESFECARNCANDLFESSLSCRLLLSSRQSDDIGEYCNGYDPSNITAIADDPELAREQAEFQSQFEQCAKNCLPTCTTVVHQVTVQSMPLSIDASQIPDNVTFAEVRLADTSMRWLGVLQFEEFSTYSFESLVGNIGGTLGLFLGATVFTFVQLVLTLIEYGLNKKNVS